MHVSNRYLDLAPVVARNSQKLGRMAFEIGGEADGKGYLSASESMPVGPGSQLFTLMGFEERPCCGAALRKVCGHGPTITAIFSRY